MSACELCGDSATHRVSTPIGVASLCSCGADAYVGVHLIECSNPECERCKNHDPHAKSKEIDHMLRRALEFRAELEAEFDEHLLVACSNASCDHYKNYNPEDGTFEAILVNSHPVFRTVIDLGPEPTTPRPPVDSKEYYDAIDQRLQDIGLGDWYMDRRPTVCPKCEIGQQGTPRYCLDCLGHDPEEREDT